MFLGGQVGEDDLNSSSDQYERHFHDHNPRFKGEAGISLERISFQHLSSVE